MIQNVMEDYIPLEWTTPCVDNTLFIHHVANIVILEFANVHNAYKQLVSYTAKIKEDTANR